jgi:hypothetical protein
MSRYQGALRREHRSLPKCHQGLENSSTSYNTIVKLYSFAVANEGLRQTGRHLLPDVYTDKGLTRFYSTMVRKLTSSAAPVMIASLSPSLRLPLMAADLGDTVEAVAAAASFHVWPRTRRSRGRSSAASLRMRLREPFFQVSRY